MPLSRLLLPVLCVVVLGGCAAPQPVEWRLLGRVADDTLDDAALRARVESVGGMPVSALSWPAPAWSALTLQCPDRTHCKRATMRLAAAPGLFAELRREDTRRLPSRPTAAATP